MSAPVAQGRALSLVRKGSGVQFPPELWLSGVVGGPLGAALPVGFRRSDQIPWAARANSVGAKPHTRNRCEGESVCEGRSSRRTKKPHVNVGDRSGTSDAWEDDVDGSDHDGSGVEGARAEVAFDQDRQGA